MDKNDFKNESFQLVASIAGALGNAHRLELLELLINGPMSVEHLANESRMSLTNTSQHLQRLKQTRLVKTERTGTTIYYMLADKSVIELIEILHRTTFNRLSEFRNILADFRTDFGTQRVGNEESIEAEIILLDVRTETEFMHGHKPGAINIPLYRLNKSYHLLDKSKKIVAYCRGELCTLADEAVVLLRNNGFEAVRHEDIVLKVSA